MSESEIRLKFDVAVESLKEVHTKEALESTKKEVNLWREKLIEVSPTFRQELEHRKQLAHARRIANKSSLPGIPAFDSEEFQDNTLREHIIEPWMMDPNLRKMNDMVEARIRSKITGLTGELVCPECGEQDRGIKMNNIPLCMKCNVVLAPKGKKIRGPKIKRHIPLTEAQKRSRGIV